MDNKQGNSDIPEDDRTSKQENENEEKDENGQKTEADKGNISSF